jgi:hypothetical protein
LEMLKSKTCMEERETRNQTGHCVNQDMETYRVRGELTNAWRTPRRVFQRNCAFDGPHTRVSEAPFVACEAHAQIAPYEAQEKKMHGRATRPATSGDRT